MRTGGICDSFSFSYGRDLFFSFSIIIVVILLFSFPALLVFFLLSSLILRAILFSFYFPSSMHSCVRSVFADYVV